MAGSIWPLQVGCGLQMPSTKSSTIKAVVLGSRVTRAGSGVAGICRVIIGFLLARPVAPKPMHRRARELKGLQGEACEGASCWNLLEVKLILKPPLATCKSRHQRASFRPAPLSTEPRADISCVDNCCCCGRSTTAGMADLDKIDTGQAGDPAPWQRPYNFIVARP